MHVFVACAPLPASTGMVHGPWSAGHPIAVVAGVGWVVGSVGMVAVMMVAAERTGKKRLTQQILTHIFFSFPVFVSSVKFISKQTCSEKTAWSGLHQ